MNYNESQNVHNEKHYGIDYCSKTFTTPNGAVVNAYKCKSKELSAPEIWNIHKQRKQLSVGTHLVVTG